MDLHHLEYITAIAREENISRAAQVLHVSQPTLSIYLNKLENSLDIRLFTRANNVLTITEAGKKYVAACEEILRIRDRLYEELYPARQDRLRIGILSSGAAVFSRIMRSFKSEHPTARFEPKIEKSEIIYDLVLRGDLDMGFVTSYEEKPELLYTGVSCRIFMEYELVLCMAKSNSLYGKLHLKDGMIQEEEYPLLKSGKLSVSSLPMILSRVMDDILPAMGLKGEKNHSRGDNNTELLTSVLYLEEVYCFIPRSRLPEDIAQIRLPFHPRICRVMISRKGSRLNPLQKQFGELAIGEISRFPYYYDM